MEENQIVKNRRQPTKFKMEDDQKNSNRKPQKNPKWKMTKKIKMEDDQK